MTRAAVALAAAMLASSAAAAPRAPYHASEQELAFLDRLQHDTFLFFWNETPADTGLTPDRAPGPSASSVASVGFALTAYVVGVERGWVAREAAAARTLTTFRTLLDAPQDPAPRGASGYQGLFYHFVEPGSGVRAGDSEVSTIDTALLMAGVLAAQAYYDRDVPVERAVRRLADELYRRVDWTSAYAKGDQPLLSMGWSPEGGALSADWRGYNEGMLLYLLALGSPTHPVDPEAWDLWTRSYRWVGGEADQHVGFGPLFGHQYSHAWIDFRGIQDAAMRSRGTDYFENSVRATYANRAYCIANPRGWKGYGELVWGLTASDGPGDRAGPEGRVYHAYWARGAAPDGAEDDGTVAPTAAGGSVPFAPEVTIPTLLNLFERFGDHIYGKYGFKDAFNLTWTDGAQEGWFAESYLGIDQGPILLMIENWRSGFVWELMKKSPYVVEGLRRAGFTGGWLKTTPGGQAAVAVTPAATPAQASP